VRLTYDAFVENRSAHEPTRECETNTRCNCPNTTMNSRSPLGNSLATSGNSDVIVGNVDESFMVAATKTQATKAVDHRTHFWPRLQKTRVTSPRMASCWSSVISPNRTLNLRSACELVGADEETRRLRGAPRYWKPRQSGAESQQGPRRFVVTHVHGYTRKHK
jgi:hypothetical protein